MTEPDTPDVPEIYIEPGILTNTGLTTTPAVTEKAPAQPPIAYIYTNDDCTGDSYSIDLEEGELFAETEFW